MSRRYFDATFIYAHLRSQRSASPPALEAWRSRALSDMDAGVISALVLDELAYRLVLAWLRDDGDGDPLTTYRANPRAVMQAVRSRLTSAWRAVDSLALELQPTDRLVIDRAKALMARPGLAPRDAFHAAHALQAGCDAIVSSDADFEAVRGLRLLSP